MEQQSHKLQQKSANWSNLPEKAIKRITSELEFYGIDYRSFRAVCRNWRKLTPKLNHFFYPVFPRKFPPYLGFPRPATVISSITYLLQASYDYSISDDQSWLVTMDEFDEGKLTLRHPITGKLLDIHQDDFPKKLNLFDCETIIVDVGDLGIKVCIENSDKDEVCSYECSRYLDTNTKSILFWPDYIAVLCFTEKRGLRLLKPDGEINLPELGAAFRCDDIAKLKDRLFALSHSGDIFVINGFEGKVIDKLCKPCDVVDGGNERKRLAFSFDCEEEEEELYLIVRNGSEFRVYKLSEELRKWERIYSFGNKILFVNYEKCFFVDADLFVGLKGDCIVFAKNGFSSTFGDNSADDELFQGTQEDLKIGVFYLNKDYCQLISSYPHLSEVFCPDHHWLKRASGETWEEDSFYDGLYSDFSSEEQSLSATSQHGKNGQGSEAHPPSSNEKDTNLEEVPCEKIEKSVPALDSPHQFSEGGAKEKIDMSLDLIPHIPSPKQVGVDSLLPITFSNKKAKDSATLKAFHGVDVSSDFIPILQKLWDKHGNIIEGHVVNSNGLLTWALESLAKITIVLEVNTGESLNDSEAEYLKSTVADLQNMHFRLDWLVPFVERALEVHKSKCQIIIMMDLEAKKSKLLAELCEVEKQVVQQKELVVGSLSYSTPSLLQKSLAEGLC